MSGAIPIAVSRQRAIDRVITVMQSQYETTLEDLRTDPENGIEELNLTPPEEAAYYYAPYPIEDIPKNRFPCVFVYPADRRVLESRASSGPMGSTQFREFQLSVALIFRRDGGLQFERNLKTLTTDDIMWLRSEYYTGAMIETIKKYGCEGSSIHKINLIDDMSQIVETDKRKIFGVVSTTWEIKQNILMPRRQNLPD